MGQSTCIWEDVRNLPWNYASKQWWGNVQNTNCERFLFVQNYISCH